MMMARPAPADGALASRTAATGARAAIWSRPDWTIAFGVVVLTFLTRLPFRTRMLWAWDSGLFARALVDYNVVAHHPQPPGYVFYVGLGKLLAAAGMEANAAYVSISAIAASLTAGALYLLGMLVFDRLTGLLAAALCATSVSFWFFAGIAYPYTVLALGSTVLATLAWLLWHGRLARPWPAALAFGLIAGFRQDLLLFLGPVFAVGVIGGLIHRGQRGASAIQEFSLTVAAGLAGVAIWWAATDLASEGWGSLWRSLTVQTTNVERGTSAFATGAGGLRENATLLGRFGKDALHLAAAPALAYLLLWPLQTRREGSRPVFLLLWMAPAVAFYLLVHIGEAGYVFSFLPAVLLAAAAGLTRVADAVVENLPRATVAAPGTEVPAGGVAAPRNPPARVGVRPLRAAIASALALLIVPYHAWLFAGGGDPYFSAHVLACRDRAIADAVQVTRANFPPETTEVVTSAYLQHLRHYLPEYRRMRFLNPDQDAAWRTPPGIARTLVFDLEMRVATSDRLAAIPLGCDRFALAATTSAEEAFTFDARNNRLELTR